MWVSRSPELGTIALDSSVLWHSQSIPTEKKGAQVLKLEIIVCVFAGATNPSSAEVLHFCHFHRFWSSSTSVHFFFAPDAPIPPELQTIPLASGRRNCKKYFTEPLRGLAKIVSDQDGFINRVREQLYPISWPWCNYLFQHIWACNSSYVVITQRTAWDLDDSRSVLSIMPWANLFIPLPKQN